MTAWEMQEPGWWTSDLGSICSYGPQEWFFWPDGKEEGLDPDGPYPSLKAAKAAASQLSNGER